MISIAFAADQLERLMGMTGFPRGKESERYIKEMRGAIQMANSEAIAEQIILDLLREFRRCPAVADILEAVFAENDRAPKQVVSVAVQHRCLRCKDFGYLGGHLPPHKAAGAWQWCICGAAQESRDAEPGLVDEANRIREKLIAYFASKTFKGKRRAKAVDDMKPLEEIYLGEF